MPNHRTRTQPCSACGHKLDDHQYVTCTATANCSGRFKVCCAADHMDDVHYHADGTQASYAICEWCSVHPNALTGYASGM